jgi:hypothetical protein
LNYPEIVSSLAKGRYKKVPMGFLSISAQGKANRSPKNFDLHYDEHIPAGIRPSVHKPPNSIDGNHNQKAFNARKVAVIEMAV